MKGLITIAGMGLIGYALYEWLYGSGTAAQVASSASVTTSAPAPAITATTASLMTAWANSHGYGGKLLTAWQWGYIYTQVRGSIAPDPTQVWPGYSPQNPRLMTLDEWFSGVGSHGVSGLSGFGPSNWHARRTTHLTAPGLGDFSARAASRLTKGLTVN